MSEHIVAPEVATSPLPPQPPHNPERERTGINPKDEKIAAIRETVAMWQAAAERERTRRHLSSSVETSSSMTPELNTSAAVVSEKISVSTEQATILDRIKTTAQQGVETAKAAAQYVYENPQQVSQVVAKEAGWLGVGAAVRTGVVLTGSALGAGTMAIVGAASAIAAGSVNAMRDFGLLYRDADVREMKISREAKKLKNARDLYSKYTHQHVQKDAVNPTASTKEKNKLYSWYQKIFVDGLTRHGVEHAFNKQTLAEQYQEAKLQLEQNDNYPNEHQLITTLETATSYLYRVQTVEERKDVQQTIKQTYDALIKYAKTQGKNPDDYKDTISTMMKKRAEKFQSQAHTAVGAAALGKGVDSLLRFASGAFLVDIGRGVNHIWQSNQQVVNINKQPTPIMSPIPAPTEVHNGAPKVFMRPADPVIKPVVEPAPLPTSNTVPELEIPQPVIVPNKVMPEIPTSVDIQAGQGIFAALRDNGFSVTEPGSAKTFLEYIAIPVFKLNAEQAQQLRQIIAEHPGLKANDLRSYAIARGITFDALFTTHQGELHIPEPQAPVQPTAALFEPELTPVRGAGHVFAKMAPNTESPTVLQTGETPSPQPPQDGTEITPASVPFRGSTTTSLRVSGVTGTSVAGVQIRAASRLQVAGVSVDNPKILPNTALSNSNRLQVTGVTIADTQPVATQSVQTTETLTAAAVQPIVIEQPSTEVAGDIWYKPYAELDTSNVRTFGIDWSPNQLNNIKIRSTTFDWFGRQFKLFRYGDTAYDLANRSWNQQLDVDMKGKLREDWIQYDPVNDNIFLQTHASGSTYAEDARILAEGVDKAGTVVPMGSQQIVENMQTLVDLKPTITLEQNGRTVTFTLTDMINSHLSPGFAPNGVDIKDYMYTRRGNHFSFFDMVPGRHKLYVIFCGASYYQAVDYVKTLNVTDTTIQSAINNLKVSGLQPEVYKQNLMAVLGWLQENDPNSYNEFTRLLLLPTQDYEELSATRYIMEFTPQSGQ